MEENRTKNCRAYHGEKTCPNEEGMFFLFWEAERDYMNQNISRETEFVKNFLDDGLSGINYDIPLPLLSTIYAYFCHYYESPKDIKPVKFKTEILPLYLQLTL